MKPIPQLSFRDLSEVYCQRQVNTYEELRATLLQQLNTYSPDGWMLLECQMLDSSSLGNLVILPYGPNNTFKEVPDHPISPRGLASDMSIVIAIMTSYDLTAIDQEPVDSVMQIIVESQVDAHVQGVNEEAYDRQMAMVARCKRMADEKKKPVILFLKREQGKLTFNPHKPSKKVNRRRVW